MPHYRHMSAPINRRHLLLSCTATLLDVRPSLAASPDLQAEFSSPPFVYRPIASYQVRQLPDDWLDKLAAALLERGYGGYLFSPNGDHGRSRPRGPVNGSSGRPVGLLNEYPAIANKWLPKAPPGEEREGTFFKIFSEPRNDGRSDGNPANLGFLTPAWFKVVEESLALAKKHGRFASFYDEVGYPSGSADHTIPRKYYRKLLKRTQEPVVGGIYTNGNRIDGEVLAVVAIETQTKQRIDLTPRGTKAPIRWRTPAGTWRVDTFSLVASESTNQHVDYYATCDYLDAEAVDWFIGQTYQRVYDKLSPYFGNVINMTFFDDVGIFSDEKTWNAQVGIRFQKKTGKSPSVFYPALWEDIGEDTIPARVAFFGARAELIGEGFPKRVTDWCQSHNVESSGHSPGNYDVQPVDMHGDPFKFYGFVDIPMIDAIFGHGFGRDGFKIISSVAQGRDRPIVAAETFSAVGDTMGYRRLIELFVRGMNRFICHDGSRGTIIGKPTDFAEWVGRCSMLLQGGRHVADIAVVYPIASLEAHYYFDAPENPPTMPAGTFSSSDTDYQAIGGMLLDHLHRNFTFVHPDWLASSHLLVGDGLLEFDNKINRERFRVVLLPGGSTIQVAALRKIHDFYQAGGIVISTSRLPSKSAEFGRNDEVNDLIRSIFGVVDGPDMPNRTAIVTNSRGGKAIAIRDPSIEVLREILDRLGVDPDVRIEGNSAPTSGNGVFSYIHKVDKGRDVFFFGNSSDTPIDTFVELRGKHVPMYMDPHTGRVTFPKGVETATRKGVTYTRLPLKVPAVHSIFVIAGK